MEYTKLQTPATPCLKVVPLHDIGMSNQTEFWILPTQAASHVSLVKSI